jgi:hypothetical protein
LSLTRTLSGISLNIVFAFAGSAVTVPATATGPLAGTAAARPAGSVASSPAISTHGAAMAAAAPSRTFGSWHPSPARLGLTNSVRLTGAPRPSRSGPARTRRRSGEMDAFSAARDLTPRQAARLLLRHRFHWHWWQFKYLNPLWARESGWNRFASNPYSGAYGIPQATPGSKMATAGRDWRTSARTQILWGMRYIRARYRTPHRAWLHSRRYGWY